MYIVIVKNVFKSNDEKKRSVIFSEKYEKLLKRKIKV